MYLSSPPLWMSVMYAPGQCTSPPRTLPFSLFHGNFSHQHQTSHWYFCLYPLLYSSLHFSSWFSDFTLAQFAELRQGQRCHASYTDSLATHHLSGTCIRAKKKLKLTKKINRGRTDSHGGDVRSWGGPRVHCWSTRPPCGRHSRGWS